MLIRRALTAVAIMVVAGCSAAVSHQTSRYYSDLNVVVIETTTAAQVRILCEALGANYSRARARHAADVPIGASFPNYDAWRYGCYWGLMSDPEHAHVNIIICLHDDQECLTHEFKHLREGQFHRAE